MPSNEDKSAYVQHLLAQLQGTDAVDEAEHAEKEPIRVVIVGAGPESLARYSSIKDHLSRGPTPVIMVSCHSHRVDDDITQLLTETARLQATKRGQVHKNKGQRKANRKDRWR